MKQTCLRKSYWKVKAIILSLLVIISIVGLNVFFNRYYLVSPIELQNPIRIRGGIYPIKISEPELNQMIDKEVKNQVGITSPTPVKARENTSGATVDKKHWVGQASVYTEEGCLGCSATLTMANGETFTNDLIIVAFNKLPLNTWVRVTNSANGLFVEAKVSDRGGFEKYNRIIDLGKATADAINCKGLCSVAVEEI
jgi:rare lipoprotein A (peptidoglycan hydrolase)